MDIRDNGGVSEDDKGSGAIVLAGRERKSAESLFRVLSFEGFGGTDEERGAEEASVAVVDSVLGLGTSVVWTTP